MDIEREEREHLDVNFQIRIFSDELGKGLQELSEEDRKEALKMTLAYQVRAALIDLMVELEGTTEDLDLCRMTVADWDEHDPHEPEFNIDPDS